MSEREIKFRVWNNNRKMFIIDGMTPKEIQNDATQSMELPMMTSEDCVWQQYTGLKDMNGVEIYEGDIIQWEDSWDEEHVQAELKYGIGKFDGGVYNYVGFYLERDGEILEPYEITNMIQDFNKKYYSYEVIGNIFEGVKE